MLSTLTCLKVFQSDLQLIFDITHHSNSISSEVLWLLHYSLVPEQGSQIFLKNKNRV